VKTYDFLSALLVEEFGVSIDEISLSATPEDLGLDSLSMLEIFAEMEEEFGIKFAREQLNFSTLGEAAALAEQLIGAKGP
jgi:acyl carrier protein